MPMQRQPAPTVRCRGRRAGWYGLVLLLVGVVSAAHADDPPPLEPDDGSGRLVVGAMSAVALEAGEPVELAFVADGAGMLTLGWGGELASVEVSLLDAEGRSLAMQQNRSHRGGNLPVRHAMIPLGEAGAYRVRLASGSSGEVVIGSAWVPFQALQGAEAREAAAPPPEPENMVAITPGQPQRPRVPRGDSDAVFLWLRYTAPADGQLALLFNANRGDLTLTVFRQGNYADPVEYVDSDMDGDATNEGVVIDMRRGESYIVRVNDLTDRGVQTRLRSIWLGEAGDAGQGADAVEQGHEQAPHAHDHGEAAGSDEAHGPDVGE